MTAPKDRSPDLRTLAGAVERLSRLLTRERDRLPEAYLRDRELRQAYLRYFLPVNRAKIAIPLGELAVHPAGLLAADRLRVLDLGSGPGTSVLGCIDFFRGGDRRPALEFTAVDAVAANLAEAETLFREAAAGYGAKTSLATAVRSLGAGQLRTEGVFDLIILSNVLNELFHGGPDRNRQRADLLADLLKHALSPAGSCVIIEPALRETSRDLLAVRDLLIAAGFAIYSPCLMQEGCPALAGPRDWCHEDRPWNAPHTVREIDSLVGLHKDSLKFSYVVLRKDRHSLADGLAEASFRVVSEPLVSKGKRELFLCGCGGRRLVMRQDKDASPANAAFDQLRRGDLVRFEEPADEGKRLRVAKGTAVIRALAYFRSDP